MEQRNNKNYSKTDVNTMPIGFVISFFFRSTLFYCVNCMRANGVK